MMYYNVLSQKINSNDNLLFNYDLSKITFIIPNW